MRRGYWECECGHRPEEDKWNAWNEARDAAGELGTREDDATNDAPILEWAPDMHGYIAWANRVLWAFIITATFAAGFLVALLWKGTC